MRKSREPFKDLLKYKLEKHNGDVITAIGNLGKVVTHEISHYRSGLKNIADYQRAYLIKHLSSPETEALESSWFGRLSNYRSLRNLGLLNQEDYPNFTVGDTYQFGDMVTWISKLFTLYLTLKLTKPDKVVALPHGSIPLAAITELFGHHVDKISAHKSNEERKWPTQKSHKHFGVVDYPSNQSFSPNQTCLILEEYSDLGSSTTYDKVKNHLCDKHGLKKINIDLFLYNKALPLFFYYKDGSVDFPMNFEMCERDLDRIIQEGIFYWGYDGESHPKFRETHPNWRISKEVRAAGLETFLQIGEEFEKLLLGNN